MIYTIRDLKNHLSSEKIRPIYLLFGGEFFLQKKSLKMIIEKVIPSKENQDFNYNFFNASQVPAHLIKESIETLPIQADCRLVVCSEAQALKEKDWQILMPVISNPVSTTVLVFSSNEWDKRKKFSKKLMEYSFSVENRPPLGKNLFKWVVWLVASHNLSISKEAMELLIRLAGPSLMSMDNELKKIKSFVPPHQTVTTKEILEVVARVRPENVFLFTEAIGKRDVQKSFEYLIHLLEDQQSDIGLLNLVARHIRLLRQIKQGLKDGLSFSQISAQTGIPSFFLKDYIKQVDLWDDKKIFQITEILHATDKVLKSSPISSDVWLENFILKACSI